MSKVSSSFKRRYLINDRVTFHFSLFVIISVFVVLFFLFEDYKYTLSQNLPESVGTEQQSDGDLLKIYMIGTEFCNPWNLVVLGFWLLLCVAFSLAFNRRLKPMFLVFFWLSFAVIMIFVCWSYLLSLAVHSENAWLFNMALSLKYSFLSKAIILIIWGFFSVFISFSYVTTKYLGIFNRLNYLFDSIHRGNWDSNMFFREGDHFTFLAPSFNALKEKYLKEIYESDEVLIQVKDKLKAYSAMTPQYKKDLLGFFSQISEKK